MVKIKINKDKCKGCRLCIIHCPQKNLILSKEVNQLGVLYVECKDESRCTGCGFCYLMCPESAIQIISQDEKKTKNKKKNTD